MTLDEAVSAVANGGILTLKEWGSQYFVEVKAPDLFQEGKVKLRAWAHPDSMNDNPTIYVGQYGDLKETVWDLFRYEDPIETVWGDF